MPPLPPPATPTGVAHAAPGPPREPVARVSPRPVVPAESVADTLFLNGSILTGVGLCATRAAQAAAPPERVSALAVRDGLVLATGTDAAMLRLRGPRTAVVDLGGAFAMPGFNDAHVHLALGGRQRLAIDLAGVASLADLQARLRDAAATAAPGAWLLGGGWDHTLWAGAVLPSRADLDQVTGDHPALLHRVDAHLALANSAALRRACITRDTPDPPAACIDRDPAGEPTGILREDAAIALVAATVPQPTPDERRRALSLALADALANGITGVQDFSNWEDVLALQELHRAGQLKLRVAEWMDFTLPLDLLRRRHGSLPADDPYLRLTQLKGFLDGSLGSRTAALTQPYTDDPANSGLPRFDQDQLNALTTDRAQAGFQIGFHAIGDLANTMALNAFAAAASAAAGAAEKVDGASVQFVPSASSSGPPDPSPPASRYATRRFRIEHAQVVDPAEVPRFAELEVIASMQPSHLLTDMVWAADRLGPARSGSAYAWRSFLDHGVVLAFGSDFPIESLNPFRGLYAAVTRANPDASATFHPEQRLTRLEALFAYTQASAFAEFEESRKGRLEPGFFADLVVLDRDPTSATPSDLLGTRVLRTVVGGETVFLAPSAAPPTAP